MIYRQAVRKKRTYATIDRPTGGVPVVGSFSNLHVACDGWECLVGTRLELFGKCGCLTELDWLAAPDEKFLAALWGQWMQIDEDRRVSFLEQSKCFGLADFMGRITQRCARLEEWAQTNSLRVSRLFFSYVSWESAALLPDMKMDGLCSVNPAVYAEWLKPFGLRQDFAEFLLDTGLFTVVKLHGLQFFPPPDKHLPLWIGKLQRRFPDVYAALLSGQLVATDLQCFPRHGGWKPGVVVRNLRHLFKKPEFQACLLEHQF